MYIDILIYSVLKDCGEKDKSKLNKLFKQIIGFIIILFDVFSVTALSELLSMKSEIIYIILDFFHSILNISINENSFIRLFYFSFRDFLLNKKKYFDI
jgi:hypothetical protein